MQDIVYFGLTPEASSECARLVHAPEPERMDQPVQRQRPPSSTTRVVGVGLLLAGAVVTFLAIFADTLEIGTGKGFGYYQMIVLIAGLILLLGGGATLLQRRRAGRSDDDLA